MISKTTLTGLSYSILTPLNVWVGYALGTENWDLAIPLLLFVMAIEFINVRLWVEAQAEHILKNK